MPVSPDLELFLREQLQGRVRTRPMFGGFGLYLGEKPAGYLFNDALYLRRLPALGPLLDILPERPPAEPPVRGAQPYWRIGPDLWEDPDWLLELLRTAAEATPARRPRRPRRAKTPAEH